MKSLKLVQCYLFYCTLLFLFLMPFKVFTEPVEEDSAAAGGRVTYDQRQNGKYNIHVSIKDVAIIEMDQNEIDDQSFDEADYYYDDDDLTVKPLLLHSTTAATQKLTLTTVHTSPTMQNQDATAPGTSTIPAAPLTTNARANITLSPNLLADIAATHAANNNADAITITPPPPLFTKKTTNVVILGTSPTTNGYQPKRVAHIPAASVSPGDLIARTKDIPVFPVYETMLHPSQRYHTLRAPPLQLQQQPQQQQRYYNEDNHELSRNSRRNDDDSKIFKFKMMSSTTSKQQQPLRRRAGTAGSGAATSAQAHAHVRRCHSNQYRDMNGDCRIKRSSSILKKLFSMLVSLPFANEQHNHENE